MRLIFNSVVICALHFVAVVTNAEDSSSDLSTFVAEESLNQLSKPQFEPSQIDPIAGSQYKQSVLKILSLIKNRDIILKNTNFDVNFFEKKINLLQIYLNLTDKKIIGSGRRAGGVNLPEQNIIILNGIVLNQITFSLNNDSVMHLGYQIFLLHECLGALGYPDKNYEISTYLIMNIEREDYKYILPLYEKSLQSHLLKKPSNVLKNEIYKLSGGGGSTGVGSGGDPASALLKIIALFNFSKYIENQPQFLKRFFKITEKEIYAVPSIIMSARIEPMISNNDYKVTSKSIDSTLLSLREDENGLYIGINTSEILQLKRDDEIGPVSFEVIRMALSMNQLKMKYSYE